MNSQLAHMAHLRLDALIGNRRTSSPGLRLLTPLPFAPVPNQRTFPDSQDFSRPFHPSSPSSKLRLRAEGIGGITSLDLSTGVLGNRVPGLLQPSSRLTGLSYLNGHFPRFNDRQDSTFPRESAGWAASAIFPPFFRVSGTLQRAFACGSFFQRIRSQSQP